MVTNSSLMDEVFNSFRIGLLGPKSIETKSYLSSIGLNKTLEIGFNSGQIHNNKTEEEKQKFVSIGLITKVAETSSKKNKKSYKILGKESLVLPLKNGEGEIVNMFFHRFKTETPIEEFLNADGLYPNYPDERCERLFICKTPLDALSLIHSGFLENRDEVLSITRDVTPELLGAIRGLYSLQSVHLLFNPNEEQLEKLNEFNPQLVELDGTINELLVSYGKDGLSQMLDEYIKAPKAQKILEVIDEEEFHFDGAEVSYDITGVIPENSTLLSMHFCITIKATSETLRERLDLLDSGFVEKTIYSFTDGKKVNYSKIMLELNQITSELKKLQRLKIEGYPLDHKGFSVKLDKEAKELLRDAELLEKLDASIGASGVIGQEKIRLTLFLIGMSYKFKYNLNAVVECSDINIGSEFIRDIKKLFPEKDAYEIDLTSSKTFRYYGNRVLDSKVVVIPDYSGVIQTKAIYDLKKLQSRGVIENDAPKKSSEGGIVTIKQEVKGHISSLGACRGAKKYFDSHPRVIIVGMDESTEQLGKLMDNDCLNMAGAIDHETIEHHRELLRYMVNNLESLEVINPFAKSLLLPRTILGARTLSMQLMQFTNLITLLFQHQREKDEFGRVVTTKEDIRLAVDMFMDSIVIAIDELDSTTRVFFDRLKTRVQRLEGGKDSKLSSREIRELLGTSKTDTNRHLAILSDAEYVKRVGFKNTGFSYQVTKWDETKTIRTQILTSLGDLS